MGKVSFSHGLLQNMLLQSVPLCLLWWFVFKAGIDGGQLSIALEPEAASLYCQLLPTEKIHGTDGAKFAVASPGSKYMVIDLGGIVDFHYFFTHQIALD